MLLLIQYTLIFASVLLLVALGGCISEHSGVINLGLEGIMVIGALGGALVMRNLQTTSALVMILLVILAAVAFGMAYSALLGVACINFKADQTIVGTALNMLGTAGATVFVKAMNTAANPDDVSSTIQYIEPKKMFLFKLGGLALDVFHCEPVKRDDEYFNYPNVILTPHIAWAPKETRIRLHRLAAENLRAYLAGHPINVVNP